MRGFGRDLSVGLRAFGSGWLAWGTSPTRMLLGAVPALLVFAVFAVGFVALAASLGPITDGLTWYARDWDEGWRTTVRIATGLTLVIAFLLIAVMAFTAVTLAVGGPCYEKLSADVEAGLGGAPTPVELGFWPSVRKGIGDGLRMMMPTVLLAIALIPVGLIPVVGQISVALLGAVFGGWFMAVEITGIASDARGLSLTERRAMLRRHRGAALGIGIPVYLLFLIPFAAVVVMPVAVAAAAHLVRHYLGGPIAQVSPTPLAPPLPSAP